MKRQCLTAILCAMLLATVAHAQSSVLPELQPVPGTGKLSDDPKATQFTFIAAGDNRPAKKNAIKQPKTLAQILKDSKQFKPVFILWSGDTIAGFRTAGQPMHHKTLEAQYKEFFRHAAKAGVPMFNSPGNHEMDLVNKSTAGTVETPDEKMQMLYLKMMQYPQGAPPYGAFDYGNSRFIAVDTEEVPPITAVRSGGGGTKKLKLDPGFVSMQQIELLTADLEANKHKDHIFVFMHHSIKAASEKMQLNPENAGTLEALFAKYHNVTYVIAAHEHIYFNATGNTIQPEPKKSPSKDGPSYLVSGGAGAPLGSCPSGTTTNCSNHHHYLVFEVNGKQVDVKVVMIQ